MDDSQNTLAAENPDPDQPTLQPSYWLRNRKPLGFAALAGAVILAIVIGLMIVPDSREEPSNVETTVSSTAPEVPSSDARLDTDGDGLPDVLEEKGWETLAGGVYVTDPENPDTDGDGLSDGEEAGQVADVPGSKAVYAGVSNPTKADSDDDGLVDGDEIHGWTTEKGDTFFTDPMNSDTDGDVLFDGDEAGADIAKEETGGVYTGFSDPTAVDSDGDGLTDAEEADNGLNPYAADTDRDGLNDRRELYVIGSDPLRADTDGDGHSDSEEDKNRVNLGLDPLFEDVQTTKSDYAWDFAKGAFAGEAMPEDSVAWLAGNIASGGTSFIPGVGWIVGGIADVRDAVFSAIQGDWVAVGFILLGLIPHVGDATAIPKKVAGFVARYPHRAPAVAGVIMKIDKIPESIRIDASRKIWKEWDPLLKAGADKKGLLRIQQSGRINLDNVGSALKRDGHVRGAASPFLADGPAGELLLAKSLSKKSKKTEAQVRAPIADCFNVCNPTVRIFDVVADGVAHESKVGQKFLTESTRRQVNSDAHLIEKGVIDGAHWHFYPSAPTSQLGASKPLLDLLEEKGISFTIHPPNGR